MINHRASPKSSKARYDLSISNNDLMLRYKFDNKSDLIKDNSENSFYGQFTGTPSGRDVKNSLYFNASDCVQNIGYLDSFRSLHYDLNFTISFWAKFSASNNRYVIMCNNGGTTLAYGFILLREYSGGMLNCIRITGTRNVSNTYSFSGTTDDNTVNDLLWHHYTYVGGGIATPVNQWYIDGVAVSTTFRGTGSIATPIEGDATALLTIGKISPSGTLPLDGFLGEILIFKRNLSANEILKYYTDTQSKYPN